MRVINCPLCHNRQERGTECDVCGRPFPEDLVRESGHEDMPVEPIPGLETTRVSASSSKSTRPVEVNAPCNWCGHRQKQGRVCERCGMQRHRGAKATAEEPDEEGDEPLLLCGECGFKTLPPRCINCGSGVKQPD